MTNMEIPTSDNERQRSESPTGVSPSRILEWNFMASRINAIVAMLRAHQHLNIPVNKRGFADGMHIERVIVLIGTAYNQDSDPIFYRHRLL